MGFLIKTILEFHKRNNVAVFEATLFNIEF